MQIFIFFFLNIWQTRKALEKIFRFLDDLSSLKNRASLNRIITCSYYILLYSAYSSNVLTGRIHYSSLTLYTRYEGTNSPRRRRPGLLVINKSIDEPSISSSSLDLQAESPTPVNPRVNRGSRVCAKCIVTSRGRLLSCCLESEIER
jgi:hypothetical protein